MKKLQYFFQALFFISLLLLVITLVLEPSQEEESTVIQPRAVEADGIYNNNIGLIIDGQLPPEESNWNGDQCVFWENTETFFVIDLGGVFEVTAIFVQTDSDDDYRIEYSLDGEEYFLLLEIKRNDGEIESGMDTMSSVPEHPEYISEWEISPAETRYIKIFATGGNDAFSVSEIQVSGFLVSSLERESRIIKPKTVEGNGNFNNEVGLIIDGHIPPEESSWNGEQGVYWEGTETFFIIDLGEAHEITGVILQVDNDDDYLIEYSLDGEEHFLLSEIMGSDGEVESGMDTMSSVPEHPEYVLELEFSPVEARYIKISATAGDGAYSISELQVFGSTQQVFSHNH